jgi:F-type H+-transporting ATPase subunit delta
MSSTAADPVAARYAAALFEIAKREGALGPTLEQLRTLASLLRAQRELQALLLNPHVESAEKAALLDRVLGKSWTVLVRAFVELVVTAGRVAWLPEITEAFSAAVDEGRGVLRALVRTARPAPAELLTRLRGILERREGCTVELTAEVDEQLMGGLQVRIGHRVIDGSVQRQLTELREQLTSVRVH